MPPHVSVIIPTYNRAHHVLDILDALEKQTYRDFEVVMSNDGSSDNTAEVLATNAPKYSFPIKVLNNPNGGRALCRNRGVEAAEGTLLVFYDDDCRPNPQSIECHVQFHNSHPNALLDGPAMYEMARIEGDFQRWRALREHSWYPKSQEPILKTKASLTGANKSVPKAIFQQLGGFKSGLNDGEDFEFAFRAMHKFNYPIYFWNKTWVYHDDYKDFDEYMRRRVSAMAWGKVLFKSDPDILRIYPERWVYDPPKSLFKRIFYRFFTTRFAHWFVHSWLFARMPQGFRYRYYERMVYANSYIYLPDKSK